MIAVGYEGEEEVVEGVWEHWDRNYFMERRIDGIKDLRLINRDC